MHNIDNVLNTIEKRSQYKQIAILYGAGISMPFPSSIPTVPEIISREFGQLCRELPAFENKLAESQPYYQTAPFEEFMSVVREGLLFRYDEILDEMKGGTPNNYHCFLARALATGPVSYLLTTNFDNIVEKALGEHLFDINEADKWRRINGVASFILTT
jgi:NAD-dependent SIR2 family protein deacetylase